MSKTNANFSGTVSWDEQTVIGQYFDVFFINKIKSYLFN
jgi:hypothetical protein